MRLNGPVNSIFTLDSGDLSFAFDNLYIHHDGSGANFWLKNTIVAQARDIGFREFTKAARKYDKKNGTDLTKYWGLKGISDEQL